MPLTKSHKKAIKKVANSDFSCITVILVVFLFVWNFRMRTVSALLAESSIMSRSIETRCNVTFSAFERLGSIPVIPMQANIYMPRSIYKNRS